MSAWHVHNRYNCGVRTYPSGADAQQIFLTAVSEAELLYGVAIMPPGKRILPFDRAVARSYAGIAAERRHAGRPISELDCQIAAICLSRNAVLVTRNVRDFAGMGVKVINPWVTV